MESNHIPANYGAEGGDQLAAFQSGLEAQQAIGRGAYERECAALEQMKRHMDTVARFMTDPHSVDHNDPAVREILGKRAAALSSALRSIK